MSQRAAPRSRPQTHTGVPVDRSLAWSHSTPSLGDTPAHSHAASPYHPSPADYAAAGLTPPPARLGASHSAAPHRSHTSPTRSIRSSSAAAADPELTAAQRIARARNAKDREEELTWQWHVWRLRTVKGGVDLTPPFTLPPPRKNGPTAGSPSLSRALEIQTANNALVARIRGQRSAYAVTENPHASSPLVRDHVKRVAAEKGLHTSRVMGSSGLGFNNRAMRMERKKIENENQALLRTLQKINANPGPYNGQRAQKEVMAHELRAQKRVPLPLRVHPTSLLRGSTSPTRGRGNITSPPQPLRASMLAARVHMDARTSSGVPLSPKGVAPPRQAPPLIPGTAEEGSDWRAYAAKIGLTTSSSVGSLHQRGPQSYRSSSSAHLHHHPAAAVHEEKHNDTSDDYGDDIDADADAYADPYADTYADEADSFPADPEPDPVAPLPVATKPRRRSNRRDTGYALPSAAMIALQAKQKKLTSEAQMLDAVLDDAEYDNEFEEAEAEANGGVDAAQAALARAHIHRSDVHPLPAESLAAKHAASKSHVRLALSGLESAVVAEVAGWGMGGSGGSSRPTALQFTLYLDSHPDAALPLVVSMPALERILPSSIATLVAHPYVDFVPLLYAVAPRFYLQMQAPSAAAAAASAQPDEAAFAFAINLADDFQTGPPLRSGGMEPPAAAAQRTQPAAAATTTAAATPAVPEEDSQPDEYADDF